MLYSLPLQVFCSAVTTELVGKARLLSDDTYKWGVSFLFFIGGLLFSGGLGGRPAASRPAPPPEHHARA